MDTTTPRSPALFVSHGSPMFAIEPGRAGARLREIGEELDARALLVVSPHWQGEGIAVQAAAAPATIHDFGGFPEALYALQYDAPGAPDVAAHALDALHAAGLTARLDDRRGRDHGAWVPLMHLRPAADLPALQVSMPHDLDAAGAFALGRALAPLRDAAIAVIGSGSLTHNLYEFRRGIRDPEYAQEFADWIGDAVVRRDIDALVDYRRRAPHAARAHPTEEHFLPLLIALGASRDDDRVDLIDGGMTYGTLSMDGWRWTAST